MVIPDVLRADILDRIQTGHHGLTKCRELAHTAVWWSGISSEIKHKVQSCQVCYEMKPTQPKEPLISTPLPDWPWKRLAIDVIITNILTLRCQTISQDSLKYFICQQPPLS